MYVSGMIWLRSLLFVLVTLTASTSGAMDARHAVAMETSHAKMEHSANNQPPCCLEGSERAQSCHVLPALVPDSDHKFVESANCEDVSFGTGLLLTGVEPSGPLDPPRTV